MTKLISLRYADYSLPYSVSADGSLNAVHGEPSSRGLRPLAGGHAVARLEPQLMVAPLWSVVETEGHRSSYQP